MTAPTPERIGIVGAGITGASTAKYLSTELPDAAIDVFERNDEVGGRLQTLSVKDRTFEAGGKFLHADDEFCTSFIEELGLDRADPADVNGSDPPAMGREKTIGIWDGDTFRLNLEGSMIGSVGHVLGSYPLSMYRLFNETSSLEDSLETLTEKLASGTAFQTTTEMAEAAGIKDWFTSAGREYLAAEGVNEQCIEEIVAATSGTTFGQPAATHTLAALFAVHSMSPGGGDPFAIEGGNARLVEGLLEASGATVHTGTAVTEVEREDNEKPMYTLHHENGATTVDAVVLATPYEIADLDVTGVEGPSTRSFHTNHVTFVLGELDTSYFGTDAIPDFVTVADEPDVPFTLLSSYGPVDGRDGELYELDTPKQPDESLLASLFEDYEVIESKSWEAYPELDPDIEQPAFEVADGLYYPNAIESIVTTVEFGAVAGRNTANLIAEEGVRG